MNTLTQIAVVIVSAFALAIAIVWIVFPFRVIKRMDRIEKELQEANFLTKRGQSKAIKTFTD